MICKHCGKYSKRDYGWDACNNCKNKIVPLRKFAKVRDDLRQKVGLKRMTKGSECFAD